jgi:oxygen-dependent protoporphyrinogen oxidase
MIGSAVRADATPVAVIGGGPSGLAAGFRLHQAGYRPILFDNRDYLGGKVSSRHRDGYVIDDGAGVITTTYASVLGIVRDSGFAHALVPAGNVFGFARDGGVHEVRANRMVWDGLRTPLLSWRSKLSMLKMARDLHGLRKDLDYADLSKAADHDTEWADEYARRRLGEEVLEYLVEPSTRALIGASAKDVSYLDLMFSMDKFLGAGYVAFAEGMGTYPEHLSQFLDVRLSHEVVGVEEVGNSEVEVTWRSGDASGTERVAGAVLAVPAPTTAAIHTRLDAERRDILKGVRYTQGVNLTVANAKAPPDQRSVYIQVPPSLHHGIVGLLLEHNKVAGRAPDGKGLTGVYTVSDYAGDLIEKDDETITRELLDGASKILPGLDRDVEFTMVTRWDPMIVMSHKGFWKQMRELNRIRRERDTRIQLAGDYFAVSNVNTASVAGERAARDLATALGGTQAQQ